MASRDTNPPAGFRTFWENSKKKAQSRNLTFVQVDVEQFEDAKKTKSRLKSTISRQDSEKSENSASGSQPPESRRQQVYQAQKRHRHRKAEYAHSLEEEISKVKNLHAITNTETQSVASENASITQYLVSQGLISADDPMVASALQDRRHSTISLSMAPTEFSIDETIMESSSEDTRSQSGGAEGPWSSAKDKSYLLLAESEFPDSHTDDESKERIKQCRDLLLKDVEPFREDEFDEEQTWNSLANLVLDER